MHRWVKRVAVVTGASSGIGAAVAEALVREGLQVVGLARRAENMLELSKKLQGFEGKLYARKCDVRKEEDILEAFEWTKKNLGGVDVLVNNAGVGQTSKVIESSTESFRQILDVNVLAVAICTREAVQSMKERDSAGHIININSLAGHKVVKAVGVDTSLYSPSKFALTALSEVVRKEVASGKTKIKVTSLSPGLVRTGMARANGHPEEVFDIFPCLESKDIADLLVYLLSTPPNVHARGAEQDIQLVHIISSHTKRKIGQLLKLMTNIHFDAEITILQTDFNLFKTRGTQLDVEVDTGKSL